MCFCCNCKTMISSLATHAVTLDKSVIIVKNVPCEECEQCGEKYFSDEIMETLESIVEKAKEQSGEMCVINFNERVSSFLHLRGEGEYFG